MDGLEPLLPQKPKHRIEKNASCVAMGPVMPELGASMANPGPFMWLSDSWNGASFSSTKGAIANSGASAWSTVKTVAAVAVVGMIGIGAGAVLVYSPADAPEEATAPVVAPAAPLLEEEAYFVVPGPATRDGGGLVIPERFLLVNRDVNGLLEGDRLVEVNGLPISASILENPRATLWRLPGDKVLVTVERKRAGGTATERLELEFEIPYLTDRFGAQSAN
jgi:hypothetical protein